MIGSLGFVTYIYEKLMAEIIWKWMVKFALLSSLKIKKKIEKIIWKWRVKVAFLSLLKIKKKKVKKVGFQNPKPASYNLQVLLPSSQTSIAL